MTIALSYQVQLFLEDRKRLAKIGGALLVALLVCLALLWNASRLRQPPSIFDTPIDNTLGYLTLKDFSRTSVGGAHSFHDGVGGAISKFEAK